VPDPIAYRLEPLVSAHYGSKKPYLIPYTKGGLKVNQVFADNQDTLVGIQDLSSDIFGRGMTMIEMMRSGLTSTLVHAVSKIPSEPALDTYGDEIEMRPSMTKNQKTVEEDMKTLNRHGRVDFCLQEGVLDSPYVKALGCHMAYWMDQDVNIFILKELYKS
jgi:hypothetical protein